MRPRGEASSSKAALTAKSQEVGLQGVVKGGSEKLTEKLSHVGDSEQTLQQLPKLRYQEAKEPVELHSLFTTQAVAAFTK